MRALAWYGKEDVRVVDAPDPKVLQPTDAVIMVSRAAICGSDLHMYDGYIPTMKPGDILGHETMGVVVDVGNDVEKVGIGDRIVVPFPIACGKCRYCEQEMYTLCDNSNPNASIPEAMYGDSPAGLYGYSHAYGGFAGGQAEYMRVPFADTGHIKIPEALDDEQVLFLSDILPTGWMAAENCNIQPGESVAVWGAGPVGLFAMKSAKIMGAGDVFAIDEVPARLAMAEQHCSAIALDRGELGISGVQAELRSRTGGRGPDAVIDAVGMEATDHGVAGAYHKAKQAVRLEQDRPTALHEAIMACRKGGTVSVPGVYSGLADKFPLGALFAKALTLRGGQTPVQKYGEDLLGRIESGEIDPTFVITHRVTLDEAPDAYRHFRDKDEPWVKVVLTP
jgi:threonine dehydrogenase-like Zn-dependent dehydrogenase